MFVLNIAQNESSQDIAAFRTLEEGRDFVSRIPGYEVKNEQGFTYEYISPDFIPNYMEIEFNGHIFPLSGFMFPENDKAEIIWKELPCLSEKGKGLVEGATRVDAYSVNNEDVKDYIRKREEKFNKLKALLESKGFEVIRSYKGSEDGEAILYRRKDSEEFHFLCHLDASFSDGNESAEEILRGEGLI